MALAFFPSPQPPSPPALAWVVLAVLPLLLGGCSGTRFGEALSRSFPAPAPSASSGASASIAPDDASATLRQGGVPANPPAGPAGTAGATPGQKPAAAPGSPASSASAGASTTPAGPGKPSVSTTPGSGAVVAPAEAGPAVAQRTLVRATANPAPYRVTIRLPQADPSAPAEVVTEALRAAGVPFEVETIERMGGGGSTTAPAVAPAAPSGPQVRPAPPPR